MIGKKVRRSLAEIPATVVARPAANDPSWCGDHDDDQDNGEEQWWHTKGGREQDGHFGTQIPANGEATNVRADQDR